MNRIRRPWTVHRTNTDDVQLNTLDYNGKKAAHSNSDEELAQANDEKNIATGTVEPVDGNRQASLTEIEVDLSHVVEDNEVKDLDADTSPYPEVVSRTNSAAYILYGSAISMI